MVHGLFHVAQYPPGSSVLLQMASFLLFTGMYMYYYFTHLSIIGHLGEHRHFFDIMFPFSLDVFSEMELLDDMIVLF